MIPFSANRRRSRNTMQSRSSKMQVEGQWVCPARYERRQTHDKVPDSYNRWTLPATKIEASVQKPTKLRQPFPPTSAYQNRISLQAPPASTSAMAPLDNSLNTTDHVLIRIASYSTRIHTRSRKVVGQMGCHVALRGDVPDKPVAVERCRTQCIHTNQSTFH